MNPFAEIYAALEAVKDDPDTGTGWKYRHQEIEDNDHNQEPAPDRRVKD